LKLFELMGVAKRGRTLFGRERLRYLLTHPYLDGDYAAERRDAVVELVNSLNKRKKLGEVLKSLADRAPLQKLSKSLLEPRFFRTASLLQKAYLAFGTVAVVSAFLLPRGAMVAAIGLFIIVTGKAVYRHVAMVRKEWQAVFHSVHAIREVLINSQSPFLIRISEEFRKLVDDESPQSLRGVARNPSNANLNLAYERNMPSLIRLLGLIAELEVLHELAADAVDEPGEHAVPQFMTQKDPALSIEEGQPSWIGPETAVGNTLTLEGEQNFHVITGPNRNGKSTLLRSVGHAVILSLIGGLPRARAIRLTPMRVRSHISLEDDPERQKSLFEVETDRLAETLHRVKQDPFLVVLFDELLRGTNTVDRLTIQKAVIPFLRRRGAITLLATHDLPLVNTAGVVNAHFEERFTPDGVEHTYRLHPGPVQATNALRVFLEKISDLPEIADDVEKILREYSTDSSASEDEQLYGTRVAA
jgi:DNA mismatch repair ATPase MutS